MKELVENLKSRGVLRTQRIVKAFLKNDRKAFVPPEFRADAYADAPLPIGEGQTISQPYTVAFMLELLDPKPGQKILDVGFGSGWTTGILADIVGTEGKVFGLEIVPELFEQGKKNLAQLEYRNIELLNKSGWKGLPEVGPFDRILVSAAASEVPVALKEQLIIGGKMVIPIGSEAMADFGSRLAQPFYGQSIKLVKKLGRESFEEKDHPGFAFVPLVKK